MPQLYWYLSLVQYLYAIVKQFLSHIWMNSCHPNSLTSFYNPQDHFCWPPLNSTHLFQIHLTMGTPYSSTSPDSVQPLLRVSCSFHPVVSSQNLRGHHLICPSATLTETTRMTPTFLWLSNPALILWQVSFDFQAHKLIRLHLTIKNKYFQTLTI